MEVIVVVVENVVTVALVAAVPHPAINALGATAPVTGPRIVQTEEVVVTAVTEHDQKVVASNVASVATSSVIAEVAAAADLAVATPAVAVSTPMTLVVVEESAEEAQQDATTIDVATAAATPQTAVEVAAMTVAVAPLVAADLQQLVVVRPVATETAA